jgi:SAM-dependent methyltransferase
MPDIAAASDEPIIEDEYTSGRYRWWHLSRTPPELLEALADGWIAPPARVLDLGCGLGVELAALAGRGFQAIGIDTSPVAVERARRAHPEVEFVVGDVLELPFEDESFDVIIDRGCFHTLAGADRPRYEREAWRVLRPGGHFLLRAFRASGAGERNDMSPGVVRRHFARWAIVAEADGRIPSDARLMDAVLARLEKPMPSGDLGGPSLARA